MKKVWIIASGKGGTGKTSFVVNVGTSLAKQGLRVLLIDLNIGMRCLDLCLGLDDRVLFDLMDVMDGSCQPQDAILRHPSIETLFLLPAAQNRSVADLDEKRLKDICVLLQKEFDLIFLDCPAGLEPIPFRAAAAASSGVVVITPDPAAIRDADRIVSEFSAQGLYDLYLVINRVRGEWIQSGIVSAEAEIAESVGVTLLGAVPEDEAMAVSTLQCSPVVLCKPESPSARAFSAIARRWPGKDLL